MLGVVQVLKNDTDFNFHYDFIQKLVCFCMLTLKQFIRFLLVEIELYKNCNTCSDFISAKPCNLILFFCAVERPRRSEHKCFLQLVLLVYQRRDSGSIGWNCLSPTVCAGSWILHWLPCRHILSSCWNDCFPFW